MLYEPVIGTCEEVVLHWGNYFDYENYHDIAQTAATALQIPQQIVAEEKGEGDDEAEVSSEMEVVFDLAWYHPMLVLSPVVQ